MSRPKKIHPPIKGGFMNIINAIADGKGVTKTPKPAAKNVVKAATPPKPKKI